MDYLLTECSSKFPKKHFFIIFDHFSRTIIQIQGFKFDPEGEYVRQWLPELARMPSEWIHHPWNAPQSVIKYAGVDLGVNYPNPIIDMDLARDRLTEAIATMRGKEATGNTNGNDEVVVDNSDTHVDLAVSRMEKNMCPDTSSHDQKVPSMKNSKNGVQNRKRLISGEDDRQLKDVNDLCSTAESSSSKKRVSESRCSFSVPRNNSSISMDQVQDSSDCMYGWRDEIGTEETSSKKGKISLPI